MDIWKWVYSASDELREQGNEELADSLFDVASMVVNEDHEKVDALLPGLIAQSKSVSNPWIELFLRHWHLQSLVLSRHQVKDALNESLSLLDFAHQEETKDCPQSICVVQDLANCYAYIDGPGYADDRLLVAQEAMDKIDASWPCFTCIGGEFLNALHDKKEYSTMLLTLDTYKKQMLMHEEDYSNSELALIEARTFIELKDYQKALDILSGISNEGGGEHFENRCRLLQARALIFLHEFERAKSQMADFDVVFRTPSLALEWTQCVVALVEKQQLDNNWKLHNKILRLAKKLETQGCYRLAFDHYKFQAELAITRQQKITAENCVNNMLDLTDKFNKDCGAIEIINQLKSQLDKLENQQDIDFENADGQLQNLSEDLNQRIKQLNQVLEKQPNNETIFLEKIWALYELDQSKQALDDMQVFLDAYPESIDVLREYSKGSIDVEFLNSILLKTQNQAARCNIYWFLSLEEENKLNFLRAFNYLDSLMSEYPQETFPYSRAFNIALKAGLYDKAGALSLAAAQREPENSNYIWDRLLVSTLLRQWREVREFAQKLEMPVEDSDTEIDLDWGRIRLKVLNADGSHTIYSAIRTGPVTAKITRVGKLEDTFRVGQKCIFTPVALNVLDQEDADGYLHDSEGFYTRLYEVIDFMSESDCSLMVLDGIYPTEPEFETLLQALNELSIELDVRSDGRYQLSAGDEEPKLGIYAYLYVPTDLTKDAVHKLLLNATAEFTYPIIWPALASAVNENDASEAMKKVAKKYSILLD